MNVALWLEATGHRNGDVVKRWGCWAEKACVSFLDGGFFGSVVADCARVVVYVDPV
jgi:hypothetical protein